MKSKKSVLKSFGILVVIYFLATVNCDDEQDWNDRMDNLRDKTRNTFRTILNGDYARNITHHDVKIWCKPCNNTDEKHEFYEIDNHSNMTEKLTVNQPIMFIIHDYTYSKNDCNWMKQMARDAVKYAHTNACIVNWTKRSHAAYAVAAANARHLGVFIGRFLRSQISPLFPLDQVSLVGHGLGAHVAGYTGAFLRGRLGYIFGLDPTNLYFTYPEDMGRPGRLDSTDASFVQILHTDSTGLGTGLNMGQQDFYANTGSAPQPNCVSDRDCQTSNKDFCSHYTAVEIFRASLNPDNEFRAIGNIDCYGYHSEMIPMVYYFITSDHFPYTCY